jgi:hypothetical protein
MNDKLKATLQKAIEKERINLTEQKEKCKVCPCLEEYGIKVACIDCGHFGNECADSDCSTAHINREDNLALCSADVCVLTRLALGEAYNEAENL